MYKTQALRSRATGTIRVYRITWQRQAVKCCGRIIGALDADCQPRLYTPASGSDPTDLPYFQCGSCGTSRRGDVEWTRIDDVDPSDGPCYGGGEHVEA